MKYLAITALTAALVFVASGSYGEVGDVTAIGPSKAFANVSTASGKFSVQWSTP